MDLLGCLAEDASISEVLASGGPQLDSVFGCAIAAPKGQDKIVVGMRWCESRYSPTLCYFVAIPILHAIYVRYSNGIVDSGFGSEYIIYVRWYCECGDEDK